MLFAALIATVALATSEAASANGNGPDTCANHVEYREVLYSVIFLESEPFYIVKCHYI